MKTSPAATVSCPVCHRTVPRRDAAPLEMVHAGVAELVQAEHPELGAEALLSAPTAGAGSAPTT